MFDGVIFDMDGLMFDTERIWGTLWAPALARFGLTEPAGLAEASRGSAGENLLNIIRHYCGPDCDAPAIFAELVRMGEEVFAHGVPKKPGLDELLAFLAAQGVPMAVASSSTAATVRHNLENGHVDQYFRLVVSGDQVRNSKPAPDIFLKAAEGLGVAPARCLVLEDSYNGVRAGHAGGFCTVMVPDIAQPDEEMRRLYTACYPSLHEVRAALESGALG